MRQFDDLRQSVNNGRKFLKPLAFLLDTVTSDLAFQLSAMRNSATDGAKVKTCQYLSRAKNRAEDFNTLGETGRRVQHDQTFVACSSFAV